MALLFCDSFAHYAQGDWNKKWDNASNWGSSYIDISDSSPRRSGSKYAIIKTGTATGVIEKFFSQSQTLIIGFGFKPVTIADCKILQFKSPDTTQCALNVTETGVLSVTLYTGTTLIASTTNPVLSSGTWVYVEVKIYVHNSSGTVSFRINGSTVAQSQVSNDTRYSTVYETISGISFNADSAMEYHISDLYVCNNSGSHCNDFLGDVRVDVIKPSGAGNYSDWTPTSGANYTNVDDTDIDDDTTVVSSATAGDKDSYAFEDSPSYSGQTIYAVVSNVCAKKDSASQLRLDAFTRISSADYELDDELSVPNTYRVLQFVYETDPSTATEWTESGIDNAEFGVMISSSSSSSSISSSSSSSSSSSASTAP